MRTVAVVTAVLLLVPSAAPAGTRSAPELVDPCGVPEIGTTEPAGYAPATDVCVAWFETLSTKPLVLRTTVEVDGPLDAARPAAYWRMDWSLGDGCRTGWWFGETDQRGGGEPIERRRAGRFGVWCPQDPPYLLAPTETFTPSLPLPRDAVRVDGNRLEVTLDFGGQLREFADEHAVGTLLTDAAVETATDFSVGMVYDDLASGGRPFRVGD